MSWRARRARWPECHVHPTVKPPFVYLTRAYWPRRCARYAYFAEALGKRSGWKTQLLLKKDHPEYFGLNGVGDADVLGR